MEENNFLASDYVDVKIDEKDLIHFLVTSKEDNKINLKLFSNLILDPVGDDEYIKYSGFYIGKLINRGELGFDPKIKPGDFDILIIPFSEDEVFFDRTCAIEVKVVRPTKKNPKKNADSMGKTQVYGLINDGFPLVGLIHICMTEPLKGSEKRKIKFMKGGLEDELGASPFNQSSTEDIYVDLFSMSSSVNQMKRLISLGFPKYVGLYTMGLNVTSDSHYVTMSEENFTPKYEAGYFNPMKSTETIERIKTYWGLNKADFLKANR